MEDFRVPDSTDTQRATGDSGRWPHPWDRDEDPDWVDPATGIALRDLADHGDASYYRWFTAMREKHGDRRWHLRYRAFRGGAR